MKIAELFAELGFKTESGQQAKLRDLANTLGDINLSSIAAALGLGVMGVALADLVEKNAKFAVDLQNFGIVTGWSTDKIQQWEEAVGRAGGSSEDFRGALKGIQQMMVDIRMGNANGSIAMAAFGIQPLDDAETILLKISKTLHENADPALKTWLATAERIPESVQAFLQTKNVLDEVAKSPFLSTDKVHDLANVWGSLKMTFDEMRVTGGELAAIFGPAWTTTLTVLNDVLLTVRLIIQGWKDLIQLGDEGIDWLGRHGFGGGGGSRGGVGQQTNHVTFHISGILGPLEAAKQVEDQLKKWLHDATYQQEAPST